MRIWDIEPRRLCRPHLLGEHRELHAVWAIITAGKRGYSKHPEVLRWHGRLRALYLRHEVLVEEMTRRGHKHATPLDERLATGSAAQDVFVDSIDAQLRLLREKDCDCQLDEVSGRA